MNYIKNVFLSIFIGAGSIAPGVSGGALAMVFGLYEKIIDAISYLFKDLKGNIIFLSSIGIGAIIGVVGFSNVQKFLIEEYPMQTMLTFAGLIVGTLPSLFKTANKNGYDKKYWISFSLTLLIALILSLLDQRKISVEEQEITFNFMNMLYLFIIGILMAGSLVIPGISGTVLLMLIGVYGLVLNAVANVKDILSLPFGEKEMIMSVFENTYILIPLGFGLLLGAFAFSKLMNVLLKWSYSHTYYGVLGFVIGSMFELLPEFEFNKTGLVSVIFFLIAVLASLQINRRATE